MMRDSQPQDDAFLQRLEELDERLEKGEAVPESLDGSTDDFQLDSRLNRGLACLKLLDNVRKKMPDTPTSKHTKASNIAFTQVKYKLPCRFGKFELVSELGRGGFGVVFLARDRKLDCEVALKMPHAHVLTNDQLRERFAREARVAAGLQHPHIVSVHEAGEIGPVSYIVFAYCPGITLGEWIRIQKDQVSAQLAAEWIANLADAVGYAHSRGVLHRDLKPSNILLYDSHSNGSTIVAGKTISQQFTPKITDFGLAKLEREKQQTATGAILGTPSYMAPEQASGKGVITSAVDIHALGVLLYEMLAGHPPYRGETDYDTLQLVSKQEPLPLRKLRPKLSRDLETICLKCLQKDPQNRYSSAQELAADLRHYLKHEPIKARPVSMAERYWRQCRRHPVVTALVVSLFLALVGGVAGMLWQNYHRGLQADATQALLSKYTDLLRHDAQTARDMMENARTQKQGREKLLSVLPLYDALLREQQTEPSLILETARLAREAGYVHQALGEYEKAIVRLKQSVDLFEQLRLKNDDNAKLIMEQGNVMFRLAFNHRALTQWDYSQATYRKAIQNVSTLLEKDPYHVDALLFVAQSLIYNCYNLNKTNHVDKAESDLLLARSHVEKAISAKPNDSKVKSMLAFAHDDYGWHCLHLKRFEEAFENLQKGKELREEIIQTDPKSNVTREELARSHWRLGVYYARKSKWKEAVEEYSVSARMNDELVLDNPGFPSYAHNAAWDRLTISDAYEIQNDFVRSEQVLREAMEIRKKCLETYPTLEVNKYDYAVLHFKLSSTLRKLNKISESQKVYHDGLDFSEKLVNENPDKIQNQELLVGKLMLLAQQFEADREPRKAEEAYRKLLKAREQLSERFPQDIAYQRDLQKSYVRLAIAYRKVRQWQDAADLMSRSVNLLQQMLYQKNSTWNDKHAMALCYLNWSRDLHELAQDDAACEKLVSSLKLFDQLAADGVNNNVVKEDHGSTLIQYGVQVWDQNHKLSHDLFLKAYPLREELYLKNSKSATYRTMLARCNYLLYLSYWHARYDIFHSIKHYSISCLLDPQYCRPPVQPTTLIRVLWLYMKLQPLPANTNSTATTNNTKK